MNYIYKSFLQLCLWYEITLKLYKVVDEMGGFDGQTLHSADWHIMLSGIAIYL